jgi:hypothetical protein
MDAWGKKACRSELGKHDPTLMLGLRPVKGCSCSVKQDEHTERCTAYSTNDALGLLASKL